MSEINSTKLNDAIWEIVTRFDENKDWEKEKIYKILWPLGEIDIKGPELSSDTKDTIYDSVIEISKILMPEFDGKSVPKEYIEVIRIIKESIIANVGQNFFTKEKINEIINENLKVLWTLIS
jgi:hypothetical protein